MSVQDAYNEWSRTYDSDTNATRDLDRKVLEVMLGEQHFESIIEIGCGTGKNTELLSRLGGRVHAIDFSDQMLHQAKEKLRLRTHVTFSLADITQAWPCADRSAALVTSNLVLEHVPELSPIFSQAARVLVKGGSFLISELHPFRQYQGTVAEYRKGEETVRISAFIHHLSDFLECARTSGFELRSLREWWHEKDQGKPPRLVSFLFDRAG